MVICDRPNPINGTAVEGNLVEEPWHSFVGQYSLPNRHGMTAGELAQLFNEDIQCDLQVVPDDRLEPRDVVRPDKPSLDTSIA